MGADPTPKSTRRRRASTAGAIQQRDPLATPALFDAEGSLQGGEGMGATEQCKRVRAAGGEAGDRQAGRRARGSAQSPQLLSSQDTGEGSRGITRPLSRLGPQRPTSPAAATTAAAAARPVAAARPHRQCDPGDGILTVSNYNDLSGGEGDGRNNREAENDMGPSSSGSLGLGNASDLQLHASSMGARAASGSQAQAAAPRPLGVRNGSGSQSSAGLNPQVGPVPVQARGPMAFDGISPCS